MKKLLLAVMLLTPVPALAQPTGSGGPVAAPRPGASGTLGFDCRFFGCTMAGRLVTAQAQLGLSTVAALRNYSLPSGNPYAGVKPYAGLNSGAWRHYAIFGLLAGSPTGSTTLNFAKTVTVSTASTSSNPSQLILASGQLGGIHPGQLVSSIGNSDIIGQVAIGSLNPQGTDGRNNGFFLAANAKTPAASGHAFQVAQPLQPLAKALADGLTVYAKGQYLPANDTVRAVDVAAGTVTLASGTIPNTSTGLTSTSTAYDGVEFTWNYTDAEAAAMSMDNLGLEAAAVYAQAQGGGAVLVPGGKAVLNQSFNIPTATPIVGIEGAPAVDVHGAGQAATTISMAVDLGIGQFAMPCYDRLSIAACGGTTRDLTVQGPNSHFAAGGGGMTLMGGIGATSGRVLEHVNSQFFQSGIAMTGSQIKHSDLILSSNYYGIYYDFNDFVQQADNFTFVRVIAQMDGMAAVAVSPNMIIAGSHFVTFTSGSGPFAFFKETGGGQNVMLADTTLTMTQCEVMGIACRGEDTGWLAHVSSDLNTRWEGVEPGGYVSQFAPPGGVGNTTAVFSEFGVSKGYIRPFDSYNWHPGVAGLLNLQAKGGLLFEGDIQGVLNTSGTVGIFGPMLDRFPVFGITLRDTNWEAHLLASPGVAGLAKQRFVCAKETTTGTVSAIDNCDGAVSDNPQGVLVQVGSANNQVGIVIHRGDIVTDVTGFQLPKSNPGSSAWATEFIPQSVCTASGGGIQPGAGSTCPNGGAKVGQTLRMDGGFSFVHINVPGW